MDGKYSGAFGGVDLLWSRANGVGKEGRQPPIVWFRILVIAVGIEDATVADEAKIVHRDRGEDFHELCLIVVFCVLDNFILSPAGTA